MRDFFKGLVFIACALIIFPAIPFLLQNHTSFLPEAQSAAAKPEQNASVYEYIDTVKIYDTVNQTTFTMPIKDYLCATLLSQLPPEAPEEAIKAQAILMYTYILNRRLEELSSPTPDIMGADISTDPSKFPSLNTEVLPTDRFISAVSSVVGKYISFNDKPIQAAFCISSGGETESSLTVLGIDLPYLKGVKCESDIGYVTELVYTSNELFARITTNCKDVLLYGDPISWFEISSLLPSGYVKQVSFCDGSTVVGSEFSSALNLPSANFTFSYNPKFDRFTFKVKGCGHLVGLSLNGACKMAQQNKTCEEIIAHFFTGVEIKDSYKPN